MKKSYYTVLCAFLMLLIAPNNAAAQFETPIGLRSASVQMHALDELKTAYLAPAAVVLKSAASTFSPNTVSTVANEGQQLLGAGLVYDSEVERLGLQLSYLYFMTSAIVLGGNLSLFLPEKTTFVDSSVTFSFFTLNVMAHYIFYTAVIFRAYALTGLNYALFRNKYDGSLGSESSSSSELGLNLGVGIEYALATGFLFLELKYIISEFNRGVIGVGYRFMLGQ